MKKAIAFLMACGLLLAVGCAGKSTGEFTYGVETLYPPMEFMGDDGEATGFDIEFAEAIAEEMGTTAKAVSIDWSGIFLGLKNKDYDSIISTISWTADREEDYSLSDPYLNNPVVLVVKTGSAYTKPEDLNGKTVAFLTDSTAQELAEEMKDTAGFNTRNYDAVTQALDELKLGRVDGVLVDKVVAKYYTKTDKDTYSLVWTHEDPTPIVVCMRKDDTQLQEKVNEAIQALKDSGKLKQLSEKWFDEDISAE